MCSHKCGGQCCQRFIIGDNCSPADLKAMYLSWASMHRDGTSEVLCKLADSYGMYRLSHRNLSVDIHLVYPMAIYLGEHDWDPCSPKKHHPGKKIHHWGCKHFDKKKGLCDIYDIRPAMCKNYPGNGPCLYPGCKIPGNAKRLKERTKRYSEMEDKQCPTVETANSVKLKSRTTRTATRTKSKSVQRLGGKTPSRAKEAWSELNAVKKTPT